MDLSYKMKSKIGKSLYHVFGMTEEVKLFDQHHCLFKDFRYESSASICQNIKSNNREKIKIMNKESKSKLQTWEKQFFKKNGKEPISTDMDDNIKKIYKQMNHSKSIIKLWNI